MAKKSRFKSWRWVVRDLSNGDGAERGVKRPRYVWVFERRTLARLKLREHRTRSDYARLGPVEKWPLAVINRRYTSILGGCYYSRKDF